MATYEVGSERFEIPDEVQGEQLKNTLRGIIRRQGTAAAAVNDAEKSLKPKAPGDAAGLSRSALQGITLGLADEAGAAATAALQPAVNTAMGLPYQEGFGNRYNQNMQDFKTEREAYQQENPKKSLAAEVGGAVTSALVAAPALAGTKVVQATANLPNWLRLALGGGAQGGVYGAGAADQGERMEGAATGAAMGAVAAPVIGGALSVLGKFGKIAAQKIGDTPKAEAHRLLKEMADAEGIGAEDAVQRLRELGPEATLADVAENFRDLARYSMDHPGAAKAAGKNLVYARQAGQHGRLLAAAEQAAGANADDFTQTIAGVAKRRAEKAGPIYKSAFEKNVQMTDQLQEILGRPSVKAALAHAKRIAADEGDSAETLLKQIHYAKVALDRKYQGLAASGKSQEARAILKLQRHMLEVVDDLSPDYAAARSAYAGDSSLLSAANKGRDIFRLDPEDAKALVQGMGESEKEMFRIGAMRAIRDKLDDVQGNADAVRQIVGKRAMQKKLETVFTDKDSLDRFIRQAGAEVVFTQTKNALTGGPNTALRLATGQAMGDAIVPDAAGALATGDPMRAGLVIAQKFFGKKKPSPETIKELSETLLQQGLSEQQVARLFRSPHLSSYTGGVVPGSIRRNVGAPASGAISNQFSDDD